MNRVPYRGAKSVSRFIRSILVVLQKRDVGLMDL